MSELVRGLQRQKDPVGAAIQEEADRLSRLDGKTSHKERFRLRNELRAEAGLPPEKKKRGGAAGFYDANKSWITPVAAGLAGLATGGVLAPMAVGALGRGLDREGRGGIGLDLGDAARGAVEGAAAGSIGKMAGGLLQPTPASFAASIPGAPSSVPMSGMATPPIAAPSGGGFSLSGIAGKAKDWLTADGGRNALNALSGAYGVYQQAQGQQMMRDAAGRDVARWNYGAPLREAGRAGLLNPVPADTSSLDALVGQGNPFARKGPPVPGAGSLAGNAGDERPGLQMRPMPATAMRGRR